MKSIIIVLSTLLISTSVIATNVALKFSPSNGEKHVLTMPNGEVIHYTAYEKLYYVTNIEDSTYQYLNLYVPDRTKVANPPIFLRTYVGGYMASKAMTPSATDATGRALAEGYVVCIPGSRGANSVVENESGTKIYTGTAPNGLLDLKAAVRYLRFNNDAIVGDAERIITDGTSAGGAMSSLLGATGNHPIYEPYLKQMGAANVRDDVFAAVCYCPITDLEHADMAYEWLYGDINTEHRGLNEEQQIISKELAAQYPAYINSLGLKSKNGELITADSYMDYLKSFIVTSAQRAQDEGVEINEITGVIRYQPQALNTMDRPQAQDRVQQTNGGRTAPSFGPHGANRMRRQSEHIVDVDMNKYLNYVASTQALKRVPSFDSQGVAGAASSPENRVFGNNNGESSNFTEYSLQNTTSNSKATLSNDMTQRVEMMNPMNFITDSDATTTPNWYIRHGARDRDTGFQVSVNLATKLSNNGYTVDFALPWNRPHMGDYNLNDLFRWIDNITQ